MLAILWLLHHWQAAADLISATSGGPASPSLFPWPRAPQWGKDKIKSATPSGLAQQKHVRFQETEVDLIRSCSVHSFMKQVFALTLNPKTLNPKPQVCLEP